MKNKSEKNFLVAFLTINFFICQLFLIFILENNTKSVQRDTEIIKRMTQISDSVITNQEAILTIQEYILEKHE